MTQPSSSSSSTPSMEYDVFLSFRGEDTRHGFISHLHGALWKKKIKTFIDYQLRKGDEISPALLTAIERSQISIVVFSKDYASSKWCLEELVKILECRKKYDQIVIPVFYAVDPSAVRNQTGTFGDAFAKHERVFGRNSEKLQRWRAALNEAANIAGWDSRVTRIEFVLVNQIAKGVLSNLEYKSSIEDQGQRLVGLASKVNLLESYLLAQSNRVRILGISGIGGIGKTTLAKAVFQKVRHRFQGSYFLSDLRERSEKGQLPLGEEKFSAILGNEYVESAFIKKKLGHEKLLFVLDDVSELQQVNLLIGDLDYLSSQSRIIITSRDKHVLKAAGVDHNHIYEVNELFHDEALQLFSMWAFGQNHPEVDFMELSERMVTLCGGVPLALKVFGLSLYRLGKKAWESAIDKLENRPHINKVYAVLSLSFDELDYEEKALFLDISCSFVGEDINIIQVFLDENRSFSKSMSVLKDKSFITVSDHKIEMHNLIQAMGRNIVQQESIRDPGKRSRLWHHWDICHVLKNYTGTESVEGISLDMSKIMHMDLHPHVFTIMPKLRVLKFHSSSNEMNSKVDASRGLQSSFSNLRYFHWHAYPLDSLPSNISPENLIVLDMAYSKIERLWNPDKYFERLKYINVSHSNLTIIPDLSLAPSLESLILEGCTRLLEIPSSIQCLKKLVRLNLRGCQSLRSLPNHIHLESLKILNLSGCSNLRMFPEMSGNIQELYLGGTVIEELPVSIRDLSNLVILDLENCSRLNSLPNGICKLKCLEDLNLTGCSELDRLPDELGNLKALKRLKISGTGVREVPSSIVRLTKLGTLVVERCQHHQRIGLILPTLSGLDGLTDLILSDYNIKQLPDSLGCLPSLKKLSLCRNNFESIPASIINLTKLVFLNISYCKRLKSLPTLPRDLKLIAHNCTSLEAFSGLSVRFMHCPSYTLAVDFINCIKLHQNALINLVNYAQQKIQLIPTALSTELDEESDEVPSVLICYPGSEVPEWFTF